MTTLSTHDTKRAEDVRARLFVLSERPAAWRDWVATARDLASAHRGERLDALTEYFLWQTVVGAWPIDAERLGGYALKAIRESKLFTMWSEPDEDYEDAVAAFVDGVVSDPAVTAHLDAWHAATAAETRANVLGQKLVQLMMPGIPDVYQGTDVIDLSLVDPDNRRPVDYASRRDRLARLDRGGEPRDLDDEKLLVTSRALRSRSDRAEAVIGTGRVTCRCPPTATTSSPSPAARKPRPTSSSSRPASRGDWPTPAAGVTRRSRCPRDAGATSSPAARPPP